MSAPLCPTCKINPRCPRLAGGFESYCKACRRLLGKQWFSKQPEYLKKYRRQWRRKNRERERAATYRRVFNLSTAAFESLRQAQRGLCAICLLPMKNPCVDHCHISGRVRGLLCMKCNSAIGLLDDNLDIVINAVRYLKRFQRLLKSNQTQLN